ncbi:hypothetical protein L873DRAFT_760040 [Choiromyces venosus 120613-1]|uniref:Uncharacterized protein n=1 Tax=Choiromyces venosus 120613-1 TaxID=1336337 RepID=A0A3N4JX07_9PEZI|nr:hypothetical protein L873DRAFT_760040 [Choiromyces venosus 120613-1]
MRGASNFRLQPALHCGGSLFTYLQISFFFILFFFFSFGHIRRVFTGHSTCDLAVGLLKLYSSKGVWWGISRDEIVYIGYLSLHNCLIDFIILRGGMGKRGGSTVLEREVRIR